MTKSSKEHGIDRYHDLDPQTDAADQLKSIYAEWADTYDHDNDHTLGTVSQPNAVALLEKWVSDKQSAILDVGCGTGLVGVHLRQCGFTTFDGTDLSPQMLDVAAGRGYRTLFAANADDGLPVSADAYDTVICVGVFTHGHLGPDGIEELLRVTRPGGVIVFTVNEGVWEPSGFDTAITKLSNAGTWKVLEQSLQSYMTKEKVKAWYVAARKC